jgi:tetratricopeptide (TPR) repeat protein
MNTTTDYRYPGSLPFQDNDIDRLLFFGREEETQSLLHTVLVENLVVLFAKSGMGKTSLLNAGLMEPLRKQEFIPFVIRFHDLQKTPLQTVYAGIKNIVETHKIEYLSGEKDTLWQYFKTAEFWSSDDILLTPVLLLDQFEELFTLHLPQNREIFITQLADLVRGRIPKGLRKSLKSEEKASQGDSSQDAYSKTPPKVKVIISIREDFLGYLEEMSRKLPAIFQNRFRLSALRRGQAQDAIKEPAELEDDRLTIRKFSYTPEAIQAMLDFLCKRREGNEIIVTDEIEPFQLQLLCQHIENKVHIRQEQKDTEIVIEEDELGGEEGMKAVLEDFYDRVFDDLSQSERQRTRKLCETGLISESGRRLSQEEEEIQRRFDVPKTLLMTLVNRRLLRAEPRVGSVYYELSHDTLVEPIRRSQKKREAQEAVKREIEARRLRRRKMFIRGAKGVVLLGVVLFAFWAWGYYRTWQMEQNILSSYTQGKASYEQGNYEEAIKPFEKGIENIEQLQNDRKSTFAYVYKDFGTVLSELGRYAEAIENYSIALELDPDDAMAYRGLGDVLYDLERYEEANENYYKATACAPDDAMAYRGLGDAFSRQGKYEEAIENYNKATARAPDDAVAYRGLGDAFFSQGKYEEAIENYNKATAHAPDDATAYRKLGDTLSLLNKVDEAIKNYNKAVELNPQDAEAFGSLGQTYKVLGDTFFEEEKYEEAIKNYEKVVEIDSQYTDFLIRTEAYKKLGDAFFELGKYDEAIGNYQNALKATDFSDADAFKRLGDVFLAQEDFEKAIEQYEEAVTLAPNDANMYKKLGDTFFLLGQHDRAVENYLKAAAFAGDDAGIYRDLALISFKQGKYDEAIVYYARAIEIVPDDAITHKGLGDSLAKRERYNEAIEHYKKAIEVNPEYANAYTGWGNILQKQHKYGEAIKKYEKAIELDPLFSEEAYTGWGNVLQKQRKYGEAIEKYEKAIEIKSQYANAYQGLGDALAGLGKYDKAIENYEHAITLDPKYYDAYKALTKLYIRQGQSERALEVYQQAIKVDPEYASMYLDLEEILRREEQAEQVYDIASQVDTPQDASYYFNLGRNFFNLKKYDKAIENYQKAIQLNPYDADIYASLGYAFNRWEGKYAEARENFRKAMNLEPENIGFKMDFAEAHFTTKLFSKAFSLANEVLEAQNISTHDILPMRFISIAALLFQGKRDEAFNELREYIEYYKSLPQYYELSGWSYEVIKTFIRKNTDLSEPDKTLLLDLIDILESSKPEADKKLEKFEASLEEMLQE